MGFFTKAQASPDAQGTGPAPYGSSTSGSSASGSIASGTRLPRDARAQAVHRLQVGLFGLAGMLLLVGLANIIMDRAALSDKAAEGTQAAIAAATSAPSETAAKDPLVDMGVAPELPVSDTASRPAAAPARGN